MDKRGKWWWINCINAGGNKKTKELFRHSWWRVAANRLLGTDAHKANLLQNPSYCSSSKVPWYFLFVYSLLSSYAFFIHAYFKHSPHPNFAQCLKNIKKVSFLYTKVIFVYFNLYRQVLQYLNFRAKNETFWVIFQHYGVLVLGVLFRPSYSTFFFRVVL